MIFDDFELDGEDYIKFEDVGLEECHSKHLARQPLL